LPTHGSLAAAVLARCGCPPKRTGDVAGSPAFMAVPCDICPRVGCPGGPARGEAVGGDNSAACC
jgi:hypothetical protein